MLVHEGTVLLLYVKELQNHCLAATINFLVILTMSAMNFKQIRLKKWCKVVLKAVYLLREV